MRRDRLDRAAYRRGHRLLRAARHAGVRGTPAVHLGRHPWPPRPPARPAPPPPRRHAPDRGDGPPPGTYPGDADPVANEVYADIAEQLLDDGLADIVDETRGRNEAVVASPSHEPRHGAEPRRAARLRPAGDGRRRADPRQGPGDDQPRLVCLLDAMLQGGDSRATSNTSKRYAPAGCTRSGASAHSCVAHAPRPPGPPRRKPELVLLRPEGGTP